MSGKREHFLVFQRWLRYFLGNRLLRAAPCYGEGWCKIQAEQGQGQGQVSLVLNIMAWGCVGWTLLCSPALQAPRPGREINSL